MGNIFLTSFSALEKCFLNSEKIGPFQCLILDLIESEDPNFFIFKVVLANEINEEFFISKRLLINTIQIKRKDDEKLLLNNQGIEFENDNIEKYDICRIKNFVINFYIIIIKIQGLIKIINTKDKLCFQILNFKIQGKNELSINPSIKRKFYFMESIYMESFMFSMNKRILISTYLICLGKSKNANKCKYKDSKDNIVELDKILEKNKIYFFGNLLYNPIYKSISFIKALSFYEEINASLDKNSKTFQITKQNNLIIEGKVLNAIFHENKIQVRVFNSENKDKIIEIQLDKNLMKNITFNGTSYFINFHSNEENHFSFGKFSHIILDTETIIEINFIDYKETNKYDMVKINSQKFKINSKKLRIVLNKVQEKNYFREKLIYMNKQKIIHIFIIEIYKGRTNKFESFLNLENDGFYYEFLYMAKKEENLLVNQKIILDEKKKKFIYFKDLEKFENKLKGRLCIINIPEQILDEKIEVNINKDNCKSFKYLILIQENQVNNINKFKLNLIEDKKYSFYMDKNYENQLNKFYNIYKEDFTKFENDFEIVNKQYPLLFRKEENSFEDEIDYLDNNEINNINNEEPNSDSDNEELMNENKIIDKRKLKSINKKVIEDNNNYRKYIELSFLKYNFENSQIQFKQIKRLCFLYILKYMPKTNIVLKRREMVLITNFKDIVKFSKGLPYIDRIRILISFINNKIFDKEYASKNFYTLIIKEEDTKNECDYIWKAYEIIYKIIDNLNENSSLFIALHQLNSYIEYDYCTNSNMFSSSILTVNDVKLDFIKNNQRYFFVTDITDTRTYAYYCPYTKTIYYNPYSFLSESENINFLQLNNSEINTKATCVSLFLTFHEDCGHLKNGINNIEDTPRQFYNNNLVVQKGGVSGINDSGYIIEYFLNEGIIHAKSLMLYNNISDIKSLLDFTHYINSDLNSVKNLLNKILFKKNKKSNLSGKKQKELLGDDDIDYEKMNVDELFYLLSKKPEDMSDKEYDEYLQNHRGYKALLKLYNGRKKP